MFRGQAGSLPPTSEVWMSSGDSWSAGAPVWGGRQCPDLSLEKFVNVSPGW